MGITNPYQPPVERTNTASPAAVLIAKSFSYEKSCKGTGAIFSGAIIASADGFVLCHDKHTWQSSGTATAMFGLLGWAVHSLMTRNKPISYPYPVHSPEKTPPEVLELLATHKLKPKSVISVIPRDKILSYEKAMLSKKFVLADGTEIHLIGAVKKGLKQLAALGYE